MKIKKFILPFFIFILLTVLTQIGGLVFLLSRRFYKYIHSRSEKRSVRFLLKSLVFLVLYFLFTFTLVPVLAKPFGRVRLPMSETEHLRPHNILTCLLNRNYVRAELKEAVFSIAKNVNQKYPGTIVNYLDANFPFINKFPLLPHLSHNDGKKIDLAFCYIHSKTNEQTNDCPSFTGYGISEDPLQGEINTADLCSEKGYWQYSFLNWITPQGSKKDFVFDVERTKELAEQCLKDPSIEKIFIEPHLKARMSLNNSKIRFHGCRAVRHDDHIHIQVK